MHERAGSDVFQSSIPGDKIAIPDKKLVQKDINRKFLLTKRYDASQQSTTENQRIAALQEKLRAQNAASDKSIHECRQIVNMCHWEQRCVKNFLKNVKQEEN